MKSKQNCNEKSWFVCWILDYWVDNEFDL